MKKYISIIFDENCEHKSFLLIEAEDQACAEEIATEGAPDCFGFILYDITPVYAVAKEDNLEAATEAFWWMNEGVQKWGTLSAGLPVSALEQFPDHRFENLLEILNK